jgi:hypothetical protein
MQTSTPCFLSVNAAVRSGGTSVRGATKCIGASHFNAAMCVKDNYYKVMRDNYRVSEVPVHAYVHSRSDVALKIIENDVVKYSLSKLLSCILLRF